MYENFILKTVPRVLSQIDRDKHSTTYGCCDRNHWHLKTRDFASAILQQSGLALALLYNVDFEGNVYYKHEYVKEWAEATCYYLKKIQLSDGSFNEYYPHEHGFPPTAFALYSACEVYKRLDMNDKSLEDAFKKTAKYLSNHIEPKAYNQELASITAMYSAYTVTKEDWILQGLEKKLNRILSLQSPEGWFSEYEGADIGYLSVSLDMLAEYYYMSKDERVKEPLERLVDFIQYFIHADGSIGGEYASRNTTYFLPSGIEVMLQEGSKAAMAVKREILKHSAEPGYFMDAVDDRYCSHYLLHSFLRALEKEKKNPTPADENAVLPCHQAFVNKYFDDSGLYAYGENGIYAIVGGKKGGVIKVFKGENVIFTDCGYRVDYGGGKVAASNWQDNTWQVSTSGNEITVEGKFTMVKLKVPTPIMHMGLRVVSFVVGNKIIGFLKKKLILVDKHTDISFRRKITFENSGVRIQDEIKSPVAVDITAADNFSLRHVASGKFFSFSDLAPHNRKTYKSVKDLKLDQFYDYKNEKLTIS